MSGGNIQSDEVLKSTTDTCAKSDEQPILLFISSRMDDSLKPFREAVSQALAPYRDFVGLWRFENLPAGERDSEDRFLRGVSMSDAVIFISKSDVRAGTSAEIQFAVNIGKDILSFEIASDEVTEPLRLLREAVRAIATVKVVSDDLEAFGTNVGSTVRDYLIRRIRHPGVSPSRADKLKRILDESKSRMLRAFLSLGIVQGTAESLVVTIQ